MNIEVTVRKPCPDCTGRHFTKEFEGGKPKWECVHCLAQTPRRLTRMNPK